MSKKLLIVFVIFISHAAVFIFLFSENFSSRKKNISEEEVQGIPLQDRMDLAMQQEFEITKDPSTNTIPRERLLYALKYSKQLRAARGSNHTEAAITGINWMERGPDNIGGRTRAIMIDPNDVTKKSIFSAGVGGGIWKTSDITATNPAWTPIDDFFNNIAVTTITFNPANTLEIYFGTGEGYFNGDAIRGLGIWKSNDGGVTWNQLASTNVTNFNYVNRMTVHPSGDVYAATRSGLFRSQNGGSTWSRVLGSSSPGGAPVNNFSDVEIGADNSIWASTLGANGGVFRSTNGNGGSWSQLNTGGNGFPSSGFGRVDIACAPSNSLVCYAYVENTGNSLLNFYRTIDGGSTWTTLSRPNDADGGIGNDLTRGQAWYDMSIAVDPNNSAVVFAGGVDLFKTSDGGSTWAQITHWYGGFGYQYVHADQHIALFEPGNSDVIYFGNDGGVWRSHNASASLPTIVDKDHSYNITQYYGCAIHPSYHSNYFLAGAQDNGSHQFNSAGVNTVTTATGGDGCFCHIDQDQPQYQWTSYVYNNYYRSIDGGATWTSVSFGSTGHFVNPTDYDNVSNILYAAEGSGDYLRWTNPQTGSTSANITVTNFNSADVRHVSVSQNTPDRVFFGLSNGSVVRVDNANTVASPAAGVIVGTPATGSVSCIAIENGNDNHILVTYTNYGLNSVWESTNALSATPAFSSVEGNLPDMPVRWALFNPANNRQALLATEVGVWSTDLLNGGTTNWAPSNSGLANTRVDMLQIRSSDSLVAAATHGRGLFTSDVFMSPYPDFTAPQRITYISKAIQFFDGSYKASSWNWNFGDGNTSSAKNPTHAYATQGIYTITLSINGNNSNVNTKTGYIQVLPDRPTPYIVLNGDGGSFDVNTSDFGSENISGTAFARGNSAVAGKNGTVSGSNAWVTGISVAKYADNSNSSLYCPNYNMTANGVYTLSFYGKWRFEIGYDGLRVEYSLNKGSSWNLLGGVSPTWYNFANTAGSSAFPTNEPFFNSDTATVFTKYSLDISFLKGNANVAFRFVFKSDGSVTRAGAAIDNFEINGPPNLNPFPVEMLYFTGMPKGNYNLLSWATGSEINNAGFEIQKSSDAADFTKIGFVTGKGNSTSTETYSFKDYNITDKILYYRLRQVDFNGTEKYSAMVAISNSDTKILSIESVYPNPFQKRIAILFNKEINQPVTIKIFSSDGKLCWSENYSHMDKTLFLELQTLSQGIYFISIECTETKIIRRIIKY